MEGTPPSSHHRHGPLRTVFISESLGRRDRPSGRSTCWSVRHHGASSPRTAQNNSVSLPYRVRRSESYVTTSVSFDAPSWHRDCWPEYWSRRRSAPTRACRFVCSLLTSTLLKVSWLWNLPSSEYSNQLVLKGLRLPCHGLWQQDRSCCGDLLPALWWPGHWLPGSFAGLKNWKKLIEIKMKRQLKDDI